MAGWKKTQGKWVRQKARPLRRVAPLLRRVRRLEKKTSAIESKFIDFTQLTTSINANVTSLLRVEDIVQGDEHDERQGDSITLTSVQVRILFTAFMAGDQNQIRIVIVHDKQANGVLGTAAQMFLDGTDQDINVSPYNLDNKHRFQFLSDEEVTINEQGQSSVLYKKYVKLNHKIRYDANTGAVSDLTSSNIIIYVIGFSSAGEGDMQSITRLRYLDA